MIFLALFYAIIFWVVASKRPLYALIIVWSLAPFQNDLGAGAIKFSLTEINLLLLIPLLMTRLHTSRRAFNLGPLAWPIGAFLVVSLLSTLFHWRGNVAVVSMLQMVLYTVFTVQIFATLVSADELRRVPATIIATGAFWSVVGIATNFFIFSLRKNAFGASLAAAALVAFDCLLYEPKGKRRNWIIAGGLVILAGLVLSLSRGSWLGFIGGLLMIVILRRAGGVLMRVCLAVLPILFICWNLLPKEQQEYAFSFDPARENIRLRYQSLERAQKDFAADPVLGTGVGLRKQYDATNLLWTTLAETGLLGAITFIWMFVAFYRLVWQTRSKIKMNDPCFSLLTVGAALMTCKLLHGMVDHYWTRGSITLAWGGVGMVLVASRLPAERALQAARAKTAQRTAARQKPPTANPTAGIPIHAYAPVTRLTSAFAWEGDSATENRLS
jgi:hypothetical protein